MRREELAVTTPCGADWNAMKKEGTKRFCADCKKHVHDLSSMTRDDARALLASKATEGLCVRYLYDADGRVAFQDAVPATRLLAKVKRFATAAIALAAPMTLNACMGAMPAPTPPVAPATSSSAPATTPTTPVAAPSASTTATTTSTSTNTTPIVVDPAK
jgi:hypothetical protein